MSCETKLTVALLCVLSPGPACRRNASPSASATLSGGRIDITVHAAGQIVPALEVLGAVGADVGEIGHTASFYWQGKMPAAAFLSTVTALTGRHGVKLRAFPKEVIGVARKEATDVLAGLSSTGAAAKKIHDSYRGFGERTAAWSRISIQGVLEAREG